MAPCCSLRDPSPPLLTPFFLDALLSLVPDSTVCVLATVGVTLKCTYTPTYPDDPCKVCPSCIVVVGTVESVLPSRVTPVCPSWCVFCLLPSPRPLFPRPCPAGTPSGQGHQTSTARGTQHRHGRHCTFATLVVAHAAPLPLTTYTCCALRGHRQPKMLAWHMSLQ